MSNSNEHTPNHQNYRLCKKCCVKILVVWLLSFLFMVYLRWKLLESTSKLEVSAVSGIVGGEVNEYCDDGLGNCPGSDTPEKARPDKDKGDNGGGTRYRSIKSLEKDSNRNFTAKPKNSSEPEQDKTATKKYKHSTEVFLFRGPVYTLD